jgi:hypothetical protein
MSISVGLHDRRYLAAFPHIPPHLGKVVSYRFQVYLKPGTGAIRCAHVVISIPPDTPMNRGATYEAQ